MFINVRVGRKSGSITKKRKKDVDLKDGQRYGRTQICRGWHQGPIIAERL